MTLPYNIVMLAVDFAAVWLVGRRRSLIVWCGAMAFVCAVALALGGILGGCFENHFGVLRLWTHAIFGHGTLLLIASAFLWRRDRPILAGGSIAAAAALVLVAADAFLIEPHWLEVSHWRISSPKISRPLRIVVVADLQTNRLGCYERDVFRQALAEKPDIILMTGDYLQVYGKQLAVLQEEFSDFLREIRFAAPHGVFAVQGNVDPSGWERIFDDLGVNASLAKQSFDLGDLQITCLGLIDSYNTGIKIENAKPDRFHLVLGHSPNFALGHNRADLLVAGHTHGGQVRFPWIGPIITHSRIPNAWAAGLTELPGGGRLLVSRGVGLERGYAPPIRFLCRPELMVIDLTPEEKENPDERK